MATKKTSSQKSSTKGRSTGNGGAAKQKKAQPTSATPKKKPGRPKKSTQSATPKKKADAPARASETSTSKTRVRIVDQSTSAASDIQITGIGLPTNTTVTRATGATPKVDINLGWRKPAKKGFWARLTGKLKRKK
jgi:hypothetical protein